jgi:hypothetical protein
LQDQQQHPEITSFYARGAGEEEVFLAREDAQRRGIGLGKKQEGRHQGQEIK